MLGISNIRWRGGGAYGKHGGVEFSCRILVGKFKAKASGRDVDWRIILK
jgi:hypothetical protein